MHTETNRTAVSRPLAAARAPLAAARAPLAAARAPLAAARALPRPRRGPLALLLLAAMLAAGGAALTVATGQLRGPAGNRALVSQAATRQVIAAVSREVNAIFSYSYADIGATRGAAAAALTGAAARQYRLLFSQVEVHGPAEKLTLVSRVVRAGVIRLADGSAELLLFLDQKWQRAAAAPVTAAAQLEVTAQLSDGHWRIAVIRAR